MLICSRLKIPLLCSCLFFISNHIYAQCPNNNSLNANFDASTLTASARTQVACCVWGQEYVAVQNMTSGRTYTVDLCGVTDDTYLTIYSDAGVLQDFSDNDCGDDGTIDFVVPTTGTYRMLVDIGSGCGSNANNHAVFVTDQGTLPVTFAEFNAEQLEEEVSLTWATLSEVNNAGFDVQRSMDGTTWTSLHFETSGGNSVTRREYAYNDLFPAPGMRYYRLQQIDMDGGYSYSNTVNLHIGNSGADLNVFPNPATDKISVVLLSDYVGEAKLTLFDLTGKPVANSSLQFSGELHQADLPVGKFSSGVYIVQVKTGKMTRRKRIVIQ